MDTNNHLQQLLAAGGAAGGYNLSQLGFPAAGNASQQQTGGDPRLGGHPGENQGGDVASGAGQQADIKNGGLMMPGQTDMSSLMTVLSRLQHVVTNNSAASGAQSAANAGASAGQPNSSTSGAQPAGSYSTSNGAGQKQPQPGTSVAPQPTDPAFGDNFQNLLGNPALASAFIGAGGGAAAAGAAGFNAGSGAAGFLGFDMGSFNPYMYPFNAGAGGMVNPFAFPAIAGATGVAGGTGASSFHAPGAKNEIKLFVGGLQFQTLEADLFQYFSQFGQVADQIVMRDKATMRGRGFGFVKMTFMDEEQAQQMKDKILNQNVVGGHYILDKKVDVKSADDYQGKAPGMMGGGAGGFPGQQSMMGGAGGFGGGRSMVQPGIPKPNPYVIAETKNRGDEPNAEVTFKYPRSKIFVGGLDFKLTVEELRHHFQQYGEVVDACILKDIYTGQSRGFGFVTFKEEDVAQDLIHNIMVTTINGRKADIKTAEVKQAGSGGGTIRMGGPGFSKPGFPSGPATIPPYGGGGGGGKDDTSASSQRDYERGGNDRHGGSSGGHHQGYGGNHHHHHGGPGGGHHRHGGGDFDRNDRRGGSNNGPYMRRGRSGSRGKMDRSRSRSGSRGRMGGDRRNNNMGNGGGRFGGGQQQNYGGGGGRGGYGGGGRGGGNREYGQQQQQMGGGGGRHREDSRGRRNRRSRSR